VSQGTVLGPLLFIIYTNGILNQNFDRKVLCFADDTTIIFRSGCVNDTEDKVKEDLHSQTI